MKRSIFFVLLFLSVSLFAGDNVTHFLGIPVDGTKSSMIQKLRAKGFKKPKFGKGDLVGEFNGTYVRLYVSTNKTKVYRIVVEDWNLSDEGDIKIRFNRLCDQFKKNKKYIPSTLEKNEDFRIPDDEDISDQMNLYNKRYEASYIQLPQGMDDESLATDVSEMLRSNYTETQIANPSESEKNEMTYNITEYLRQYSNKLVWFMIDNTFPNYRILLFYDNLDNQANGEDL